MGYKLFDKNGVYLSFIYVSESIAHSGPSHLLSCVEYMCICVFICCEVGGRGNRGGEKKTLSLPVYKCPSSHKHIFQKFPHTSFHISIYVLIQCLPGTSFCRHLSKGDYILFIFKPSVYYRDCHLVCIE